MNLATETDFQIAPRPAPLDAMGLPIILDELGQRVPLRTLNVDGTEHFSDLKHIGISGREYLHACNVPFEPTRDMLIGTAVHNFVLGDRTGAKPLVLFDAPSRTGNAWKNFRALHPDAEILTAPEWNEAQRIAASVVAHPLTADRFSGARFEVPLHWEEVIGDRRIPCSTTGIDIVCASAIGDLKCTRAKIHRFERHAFEFSYPHQLAWYRRAARANGLDTSQGLFLLGAMMAPPHDVIDLELTEGMIDYADRIVSGWLAKLAELLDMNPAPRAWGDWPGFAQSPLAMDLPRYLQEHEDEGDGEGEEVTT